MPTVTRRASRRPTVIAALIAVAVLLLASAPEAQAALQKLAGYDKGNHNDFASLYSYLANLRDSLLPLAVPMGTIGLVVVGGMYMFGSPAAGRTLFGVGIGLGLVLLAPSIIA
jgi:type IV secretory pathway VirB2 component (pilin)